LVKSYALYFVACALHFVLLFLFSNLQLYRRQPFFMLWLLAEPFSNLAIWVLYWSKEYPLMTSAKNGLDILWYAILAAALVQACLTWGDPVSSVLRRGIIGLVLLAVIGREAGGMKLAGGFGVALATAMNLAYMAPTAYLVAKLSGVRLERIPLWLHEDTPWVTAARQVWGYAHSLLS
jgi:hypothetical protein